MRGVRRLSASFEALCVIRQPLRRCRATSPYTGEAVLILLLYRIFVETSIPFVLKSFEYSKRAEDCHLCLTREKRSRPNRSGSRRRSVTAFLTASPPTGGGPSPWWTPTAASRTRPTARSCAAIWRRWATASRRTSSRRTSWWSTPAPCASMPRCASSATSGRSTTPRRRGRGRSSRSAAAWSSRSISRRSSSTPTPWSTSSSARTSSGAFRSF